MARLAYDLFLEHRGLIAYSAAFGHRQSIQSLIQGSK
jgi:hypothetical protein